MSYRKFLITQNGSTLSPDKIIDKFAQIDERLDRHDTSIDSIAINLRLLGDKVHKTKPRWNKLRGIWNIIKS